MSEPRKLEFVLEIDAPPEEVWKALTEADQITRWFCPDARVEPGEGGSIWISWGPGMEAASPIRIWEPGRHLQTGSSPKVIDYFLEAKGGGTVLRLVHSGFGAEASFDDEYDSTGNGWRMFLAMLGYSLTRGRGVPARHVCGFHFLKTPREEAWRRLVGDDEFRVGQSYRAVITGSETLEGQVLCHPRAGYLCLTVDGLDGSLLGLFAEKCHGMALLTVSWILYGSAVAQAPEIDARWRAILDRLFPESERVQPQ